MLYTPFLRCGMSVICLTERTTKRTEYSYVSCFPEKHSSHASSFALLRYRELTLNVTIVDYCQCRLQVIVTPLQVLMLARNI